VDTSRSRGVDTRYEQSAREDPPFVAVLGRRTRCAVLVRGGASPAETTARTFTRSGPVHAEFSSSEALTVWLVSPCRPREGADEGEGGGRFVTSLLQHEETKQLAVGARASSYCRSRQNALGLREARHL